MLHGGPSEQKTKKHRQTKSSRNSGMYELVLLVSNCVSSAAHVFHEMDWLRSPKCM